MEDRQGKKKASKADQAEFADLWGRFVDIVGLSNDAFWFLHNGFKNCAAKPLYDFLKRSSNGKFSYRNLASYEAMRLNRLEFVLKLHISLLAQELISPTSAEQLAYLMREIPVDAISKENKTTGNIRNYFSTFLISELSGRTLGVKKLDFAAFSSEVRSFSLFAIPVLKEIGSSTKSGGQQEAVINLLEWLGVYSEKEISEKPAIAASEQQSARDEASESVLQESVSRNCERVERCDDLRVDTVVEFIQSQGRKLESLISLQAALTEENQSLKKSKIALQEQVSLMEGSLNSIRSENTAMKLKISQLEESVEELNSSLSESRQMVEILSNGNARKKDETFVRLAQCLAPEYADYCNSLDDVMSLDLGENLRDMLGEVFKLLRKNGIEL